MEIDLQIHKEATKAKFNEFQSSLEAFCSQQAQFQTDILEEFRQLRLGPNSPVSQVDLVPLQFGTLPATSSPVRVPTSTYTSSSMVALSEGNIQKSPSNCPLNLSHNEVILGLNSEINASTVEIPSSVAISGAMICSNRDTDERNLGGLHVASNNEVLNKSSVGSPTIHSQPA